MKRAAAIPFLLAALAAAPASAQTKAGTTLGQFLGIEPSARSAAMGAAGAALTDGIGAVYFNTGAIATITRPSLQFTHSLWFADIAYDYAAGALPVERVGVFFASVTALNSGEIDVRTVDRPLGTGERYTVSNVAVGLGYGRRVTERFVAGFQVNYVHERIWNSSLSYTTFSAGTVYQLTESGIRIGSSLANLGTDSQYGGRDLAIQYDDQPDVFGNNSALPGNQLTGSFPVPILARVGLGVPRQTSASTRLLLLVDALHPNDNTESVNAGLEWGWPDALALRAGWQTLFQEDSELGATLGFGLESGIGRTRFDFDYAWAGHRRLDDTHRMTLVLVF
jgi:hypothetical protein